VSTIPALAPAFLVVLGAILGVLTASRPLPQLTLPMLALVLPIVIFDGGWHFNSGLMSRIAPAAMMLAGPGAVFGALVVTGAAWWSGMLEPIPAFSLGAMLAATDPIAVLFVFKRMPISRALTAIVEAESILNDAVAVVLVQAALSLVGHGVRPSDFALAAVASIFSLIAGIGIGSLIALASFALAPRATRSVFPLTLLMAYVSYGAAVLIGASGIIAAASAAVLARTIFERRGLDLRPATGAWRVIGVLANVAVFILLGVSLRFEPTWWPLAALTVAALILSRFPFARFAVPLQRLSRHPKFWQYIIGLSGLRGGLPLALALSLPPAFAQRDQIIVAVSAVVVVTLVGQSLLIVPLVEVFGHRLHDDALPDMAEAFE
jgi:CPA1 family monovalent cation:H+ antiporter